MPASDYGPWSIRRSLVEASWEHTQPHNIRYTYQIPHVHCYQHYLSPQDIPLHHEINTQEVGTGGCPGGQAFVGPTRQGHHIVSPYPEGALN